MKWIAYRAKLWLIGIGIFIVAGFLAGDNEWRFII